VRSGLRLANWIAEEWFRQGVAWLHERRGAVILFDRHFFCDYYANDVLGQRPGRPWTSRLHGAMLERLYPRPDMVILLDAPAQVLFDRKGEGTVESLERKRQEYLALAPHVRRFEVVDATRPVDAVVADVVDLIRDHLADGDRVVLRGDGAGGPGGERATTGDETGPSTRQDAA
jgi:thymidylate kinase